MNALSIISQKRDGIELSENQVKYMVSAYNDGRIHDYQMSAFLMSVFFQGMTPEELIAYTDALVKSGKTLSWDNLPGISVDKHSSGGVGDKTTLVVAPLVVAAGLYMPKISGRGLGFTGGTIDKLESIPGFNADLTINDFKKQVERIGMAVISQTKELTPADGKIYALRDVTATVDSIPLIAASIMSKKIAVGADCIILDVKTGSGAFMKKEEDAELLARTMVEIGVKMGRKVRAIVSEMEQPLGNTVGNSLEIEEVLSVLKGEGPKDIKELSLTLAAYLLIDSGKAGDFEEAYKIVEKILTSGQAYEKFVNFIASQGGDLLFLQKKLPEAIYSEDIIAKEKGYIVKLDARIIGKAAGILGAGRFVKGEPIDPGAGILIHAKIGDYIEKGMPLFTLFTNERGRMTSAVKEINKALAVSEEAVDSLELIKMVIE